MRDFILSAASLNKLEGEEKVENSDSKLLQQKRVKVGGIIIRNGIGIIIRYPVFELLDEANRFGQLNEN